MSSIPSPSQVPPSAPGDPAWELALLYPLQGTWSVQQYLDLTEQTNQLVEFNDGKIEVLELPSIDHQLILLFLIDALRSAAERDGGMALMAPHPTTLRPQLIREPDIVFKLHKNLPQPGEQYFQGADLVIEIVSPDKKSQRRDYEEKKSDYAKAGIPEYWIVDPQKAHITVLTLERDAYETLGVYHDGETASSQLLPEFTVEVSQVFAAGKQK